MQVDMSDRCSGDGGGGGRREGKQMCVSGDGSSGDCTGGDGTWVSRGGRNGRDGDGYSSSSSRQEKKRNG